MPTKGSRGEAKIDKKESNASHDFVAATSTSPRNYYLSERVH